MRRSSKVLPDICQQSNCFSPARLPRHIVKFRGVRLHHSRLVRSLASLLGIVTIFEVKPLLNTIMIRSTLKASTLASRRVARNNGAIRTMAKEIKFGVEGRAAMLKGVETLADAVQVRS